MTSWEEAFAELSPEQQERVKGWLRLQYLIAETLRISWDKWIERYVGSAMEAPFDYSFMEAVVPGFAGLDLSEVAASFTKEGDAATATIARVPLRAQNNLGKLSPATQDKVAAMLEGEVATQKVPPGDVVHLQKIFRKEAELGRLRQPDFRKVTLAREGDEMVLRAGQEREVLRMNVMEFGAVMRTALV